jgi:hypothetical protein
MVHLVALAYTENVTLRHGSTIRQVISPMILFKWQGTMPEQLSELALHSDAQTTRIVVILLYIGCIFVKCPEEPAPAFSYSLELHLALTIPLSKLLQSVTCLSSNFIYELQPMSKSVF